MKLTYTAYQMLLDSCQVSAHQLALDITRCYYIHETVCIFGSDSDGITLCPEHSERLESLLS